MKLKTVELNGATYAEVADGKPIYILDDNKEAPFDVPDMYGRLSRDGKRNSELQKGLTEANEKLKAFDGFDIEAGRRALEKVKSFSDADFIKTGEVEQMKTQWQNASKEEREAAVRASNAERDRWKTQAETLENALFSEKVGGAFSRSKFIADKVAVPGDLLQDKFGSRFKVIDGRIVGHGADGQPIYSRVRAGEIASFDEALESLVDAYPFKDAILKGTGHSGSGARPSLNAGGNGRTMRKAQFDALHPLRQAELMRSKDAPTLVD